MTKPVARYTSSRWYSSLALFAIGCALLAGGMALRWPAAALAASIFAIAAIVLGTLALRPPIEIHESHLLVGSRAIAWREIRRVDQTHWQRRGLVPLAVHVTLEGENNQILVIYAGSFDSGRDLLRHLRRYSHRALLDGIPYRQFWGEINTERAARHILIPDPFPVPTPAPTHEKAPLLLPEDEAEVERLFQRLKSAGRLDTPSLPQ